MGIFSDVRNDLQAKLSADMPIPILDLWPDRFNPPCAIVGLEPGKPYTPASNRGRWELQLTIVIYVPQSSQTLVDLEELVEQALPLVADMANRGVDSPSVLTMDGMELLATTIHVAKTIQLY